jgi:hypothetical protein
MAFMEPQIEHNNWFEVETDNGTEFVPVDLIDVRGSIDIGETLDPTEHGDIIAALHDYCEGRPQSVKLIEGFGARLSAPGYLDCTPWCVFATEEEAQEYIKEELGADEEPDDTPDGWDSVETDSD